MDDLEALRRRLLGTEGVELLPTVTAEAIAAFEAEHAIQLPGDFRAFLSRLAGGLWMYEEPALFSLEDISLVLGTQDALPAQPFPYDADEVEALRRYLSGPRPAGGLAGDPAFAALQKPHDSHGCLPLTDHGCNEGCVLVVTGPLRGQIWRLGQLDLPESRDLYRPDPNATAWAPIGFARWLPLWAEQFLGAVAS